MSVRFVLTLAASLLAAGCVWAKDVTLQGALTQGGLIVGQAPGATSATINGRAVAVAPDGTFVFGLPAEAKAAGTLLVKYPDGTEEARALTVVAQKWKIERIDGLPPAMVNPPPEVTVRINRENALIAKARSGTLAETWFAGGFAWPVKGRISGVFGSRRVLNGQEMSPHWGMDIAMPTGTPVLAPAFGRVVLAENDLYYTGGTIILDHGYGVTSAYSHLSKVGVKVGQTVQTGEQIGAVGATGRVTGPHLHWTINWFDVRIDPALVVQPPPGG